TLIRHDAPFLLVLTRGARLVEVLAVRPPERRRRQLQLASLERLNILDAPLAVATLTHDDGAEMVLEASRDDFASAGAHAVDQANHRKVEVTPFMVTKLGLLATDSRTDGHNLAVVDKQVGDLHGTAEQPPWIEA